MRTHHALLALLPAVAIAATACTANVTTGAPTTVAPSTVVTTVPTATTVPADDTTPAATTVVVTSVAQPPPSPTCGPQTAQEAFDAHVHQLPPVAADSPNAGWILDPAGNGYEPCGHLSWLRFTNRGGSAAAPYGILLFYHGTYLGLATKELYGFRPQISTVSPDVIQVAYRYPKPGESTAEASGSAVATFSWDAAQRKIVQTGDLPPK